MSFFRMIIRLLVGYPPAPGHRNFQPTKIYDLLPTAHLRPPPASHRMTAILIEEVRSEVSGRCWVIDGDTIDIGGLRIRLSGIDAPELDHPYGRPAKSALIALCKGQIITARFAGTDDYGRNLAACFLPDGRDLAAEMVAMGMAIDWAKYSGGKYRALEVAGIRKRLWRCDARQKGRLPPPSSRQA